MSVPDWPSLLHQAISSGALIQLTLSRPVQASSVSKVTIRPVVFNNHQRYQWTSRRGPQEFHENLTPEELLERVGAAFANKYADLHWFAADADMTVRQKPDGRCQIKRKPPTKVAEPLTHNRSRQYLLPENQPCPFLQAMGVMSATGHVHASMYHKFRQINRYLEFVDDIYPELPSTGPVHVVDCGCGKSYLTFAVHHYLTVIKSREAVIVGLDLKQEVIEKCRAIVKQLDLNGLEFVAGDIQSYQPQMPVHLVVSLHACDTATDDALAQALCWKAKVIFAVPCCQHEIARQLPATTLAGLTGYGLLKERFAADVTDALRARYLETQGYRTQIVEFIELEHTPKNLLIRAVHRLGNSETDVTQRIQEYQKLKEETGITTWHLEQAMSARLSSGSPHGEATGDGSLSS